MLTVSKKISSFHQMSWL